MKVLVTGATGYVGREVAAAVAEAGHETRGLVRPGSRPRCPPASPLCPAMSPTSPR